MVHYVNSTDFHCPSNRARASHSAAPAVPSSRHVRHKALMPPRSKSIRTCWGRTTRYSHTCVPSGTPGAGSGTRPKRPYAPAPRNFGPQHRRPRKRTTEARSTGRVRRYRGPPVDNRLPSRINAISSAMRIGFPSGFRGSHSNTAVPSFFPKYPTSRVRGCHPADGYQDREGSSISLILGAEPKPAPAARAAVFHRQYSLMWVSRRLNRKRSTTLQQFLRCGRGVQPLLPVSRPKAYVIGYALRCRKTGQSPETSTDLAPRGRAARGTAVVANHLRPHGSCRCPASRTPAYHPQRVDLPQPDGPSRQVNPAPALFFQADVIHDSPAAIGALQGS